MANNNNQDRVGIVASGEIEIQISDSINKQIEALKKILENLVNKKYELKLTVSNKNIATDLLKIQQILDNIKASSANINFNNIDISKFEAQVKNITDNINSVNIKKIQDLIDTLNNLNLPKNNNKSGSNNTTPSRRSPVSQYVSSINAYKSILSQEKTGKDVSEQKAVIQQILQRDKRNYQNYINDLIQKGVKAEDIAKIKTPVTDALAKGKAKVQDTSSQVNIKKSGKDQTIFSAERDKQYSYLLSNAKKYNNILLNKKLYGAQNLTDEEKAFESKYRMTKRSFSQSVGLFKEQDSKKKSEIEAQIEQLSNSVYQQIVQNISQEIESLKAKIGNGDHQYNDQSPIGIYTSDLTQTIIRRGFKDQLDDPSSIKTKADREKATRIAKMYSDKKASKPLYYGVTNEKQVQQENKAVEKQGKYIQENIDRYAKLKVKQETGTTNNKQLLEVKRYEQEKAEQEKTASNIDTAKLNDSIDKSLDTEKIKQATYAYKDLIKTINEYVSALSKGESETKSHKNLDTLRSEILSSITRTGKYSNIDLLTDSNTDISQLLNSKIQDQITKIQNKLTEAKKDINGDVGSYSTKVGYGAAVLNMTQEMDQLYGKRLDGSQPLDIINAQDLLEVQELIKKFSELDTTVKQVKKDAGDKLIDQNSIAQQTQSMSQWLNQNSRAYGLYHKEINNILTAQKSLSEGNATAKDLTSISEKFADIQAKAQLLGTTGNSVLSSIDKQFQSSQSGIISQIASIDLVSKVRELCQESLNLNSALVELSKVSDQSLGSLNKNFTTYVNMAKEIGASTQDAIEATENWSRNGYNLADAQELAKVSMLYKNVGDGIDITQANESLISTLRGFKLEANDAMSIIDKFNEVSNNEPIDSGGIGTALQRSAASFNAAHTDLDEAIALITATNSVVQDPEKVGNMWKTVSARLRGASTELTDMGEDTDGLVTSTSKLQSIIKSMTGFDILEDDQKTFKSIYQIVLGIGKQQDKLNDIDKASLLETLAGKVQSNSLAAALSNTDVLEKAYNESINSEGSAEQEEANYQQGMQYHIDQLTTSWESFAHTVIDSDISKSIIDITTKVITLADKLHQLTGYGAEFGLQRTSAVLRQFGGLQGIQNLNTQSKDILGQNIISSGQEALQDNNRLYLPSYLRDSGTKEATDYFDKLWEIYSGKSKRYKLKPGEQYKNTDGSYQKAMSDGPDARAKYIEDFKANKSNHLEDLQLLDRVGSDVTSKNELIKRIKDQQSAMDDIAYTGKSLIKNIGINFAITVAATIAEKVGSYLLQKKAALQSAGKEFATNFTNGITQVSDFKSQYEENTKVLNDQTSSIEAVTQARQNLAQLQQTMISQYGKEANGIDTVTKALNGQSNAWDQLNQMNFKKYEKEFNSPNSAQQNLPWIGSIIAKSNGKNALATYYRNNLGGSSEDQRYLLGHVKDSDLDQLIKNITGSTTGSDSSQMNVSGNVSEVLDKLLRVQAITQNSDKVSDSQKQNLSDLINKAETQQASYEEYAKNATLYNEILSQNSQYKESYNKLNELQNKYTETVTKETGNEEYDESIKKQEADIVNEYSNTLTSVLNRSGISDSVYSYFKNMGASATDGLSDALTQNNIQKDFNSIFKNVEDYLQEYDLTSTELESLNNAVLSGSELTEPQSSLYQSLTTVAQKYNLSVSQLIDNLQKLNIVESENQRVLKNQLGEDFYNSLSKDDVSKINNIDNIQNELSQARFRQIYKSLYNQQGNIAPALSDVQHTLLSNQFNFDNAKLIQDITDKAEQGNYVEQLSNAKQVASDYTNSITTLTEAISDQNKNGYISQEQFSSIASLYSTLSDKSGKLSDYYMLTAQGVELNTSAVRKLLKEKQVESINEIDDGLQKLNNSYDAELVKIETYKTALSNLTKENIGQKSTYEQLIADHEKNLENLEKERVSYEALKSSIQDLTPEYTEFNDALNSTNAGAHYDSIRSAYETIKKELENGELGTDEMTQWGAYWTNNKAEDIEGMDRRNTYSTILQANKKYNRYSTEKEDGITHLHDDLKKLGDTDATSGVQLLKDGTMQITDMDEAAQKLGISVSALVDGLNKMKDFKKYGIQFSSSDYDSQLQNLYESKNKIETSLTLAKNNGASQSIIDDYQEQLNKIESDIEKQKVELKVGINPDEDEATAAAVKLKNDMQNILDKNGLQIGDIKFDTANNTFDVNTDNISSEVKEQITKELNDIYTTYNNTTQGNAFKYNLEADLTLKDNQGNIISNGLDENLSKDITKTLTIQIDGSQYDVDIEKYTKAETKTITIQTEYLGSPSSILNPTNDTSNTEKKKSKPKPAKAHGTLNNRTSGKTLVGELGPEMVVRGSTSYTVGNNGPEYVNLKRGDIVFTADQTKDLLTNGQTHTTGKAMASGNVVQKMLGAGIFSNKYIQDHIPKFSDLKPTIHSSFVDKIINDNGSLVDKSAQNIIKEATEKLKASSSSIEKSSKSINQSSKNIKKASENIIAATDTNQTSNVLTSVNTTPQTNKVVEIGNKIIGQVLNKSIIDTYEEIESDIQKFKSTPPSQYIRSGGSAYVNGKNNVPIKKSIRNSISRGKSFTNGQNNALVGELGPELRVRDGQYELLGENGPEMSDVRTNDIIFNTNQTKDLLAKGHTSTRGHQIGGLARIDGQNNNTKIQATVGNDDTSLSELQGAKKETKSNSTTSENTKALDKNTNALDNATKSQTNQSERAIKLSESMQSTIEGLTERTDLSYSQRKEYLGNLKDIQSELLKQYEDNYNNNATLQTNAFDKLKTLMNDPVLQPYLSGETYESIANKILNGNTSYNDFMSMFKGPQSSSSSNDSTDTVNKLFSEFIDAIKSATDANDSYIESTKTLVEAQEKAIETAKKIYELDIAQFDQTINEFKDKIDSIQANIDLKGTVGEIVSAQDYADMIGESYGQSQALQEKLSRQQERLNELTPDSDDYYDVLNAINETKSSLRDIEKQQAEQNEAIKTMPLEHLNQYIEDLKNIQSQMTNLVNQLEAKGQETTANVIQDQVNFESKLIEQYSRKVDETKKLMDTYTPGSEKQEEQFSNLVDTNNQISELVVNMINFNKQMLAIPVDKLKDAEDKLSKINQALNDAKNDHVTVIESAIAVINKYNEDIQDNLEAQTKPLQDQLTLLQKQNEQKQRELDIENARYNLQKAMDQRTVQVTRNGRLVYDSNSDDVRSAQNDLQQAQYNKTTGDIQDQVDALNDAAQTVTDANQKIIDKWQKIQSDEEYKEQLESAAKLLGITTDQLESMVINSNPTVVDGKTKSEAIEALKKLGMDTSKYDSNVTDTDIYNKTKTGYEDISQQIKNNQEESDMLNRVTSLLEDLNSEYIKGNLTSDQLKEKTDAIIDVAANGFTGAEELAQRLSVENLSYSGEANEQAEKQREETKALLAQIVLNTDKNNDVINKNGETEQSTEQKIKDLLEQAEIAYKNAKEAEKYGISSEKYYGGSGSGSGVTASSSGGTVSIINFANVEEMKKYAEEHPGSQYISNGRYYIANDPTGSNGGLTEDKYNDNYHYHGTMEDSNGVKHNVSYDTNGPTGTSSDKYVSRNSSSSSGNSISASVSGNNNNIIVNGKDYGSLVTGKITRHASGINTGIVGSATTDDKYDMLRELSTMDLKPQEIPSILDVGEVVLNPQQQSTLLNNFKGVTSMNALNNGTVINPNTSTPNIEISFGDISLPNVTNGQEFAESLNMNFKSIMSQYFSKYFK